jgi:hypothetical protein
MADTKRLEEIKSGLNALVWFQIVRGEHDADAEASSDCNLEKKEGEPGQGLRATSCGNSPQPV